MRNIAQIFTVDSIKSLLSLHFLKINLFYGKSWIAFALSYKTLLKILIKKLIIGSEFS